MDECKIYVIADKDNIHDSLFDDMDRDIDSIMRELDEVAE